MKMGVISGSKNQTYTGSSIAKIINLDITTVDSHNKFRLLLSSN